MWRHLSSSLPEVSWKQQRNFWTKVRISPFIISSWLTYIYTGTPQQLLMLSFGQPPKLLSLQYRILWTSGIRPASYPPQHLLLILKRVIIKIWRCTASTVFFRSYLLRHFCSPCRRCCLTGRWQRFNRQRRFAGYSHCQACWRYRWWYLRAWRRDGIASISCHRCWWPYP